MLLCLARQQRTMRLDTLAEESLVAAASGHYFYRAGGAGVDTVGEVTR